MIEVQISAASESEAVIRAVEQSCASQHLTCGLKTTLATYPGSVHWHFKRAQQKGTLEVTWWKQSQRLWFKVSKGRTSDWILDTMPVLKEQLEKMLL